MRLRNSVLQLSAIAALSVHPAYAQEAEAPTPSRSTESYQAWTVECTSVAAAPEQKAPEAAAADKPADAKSADAKPSDAAAQTTRICEAAQIFTNRNTGSEIARFVFALDPKDPAKLVAGMRTVVDISMDKNAAIVDGDNEIATGKVVRCTGNFCFTLFEIDDTKVEQFLKTEKPGVQYPIASGQMLRISMSTAGLSDALAALKNKK